MRRFRIYVVSTIGGLAGAVTVLWISSLIERQQAEQWFERMRNAPPVDPGFQGAYGGVMGSVQFGPGLFTWFLTVMVCAAVFYFLLRWQDR
jgi:hypothetical protein